MKRLIALSLMWSFSLSPAAAAAAATAPAITFDSSIFGDVETAAKVLRNCLEHVYHNTPQEGLADALLAMAQAFNAAAKPYKMSLNIEHIAKELCANPYFLMFPIEEQERRIAATLSLMHRSKSSKVPGGLANLAELAKALDELTVDTAPHPATAAKRAAALPKGSPCSGSTDGDSDAMPVEDNADEDDADNVF